MSSYCCSDLLLATPSDLLWSVALPSKLLLTTKSLYMWFYTGHTFLLLWMGATVLDAPFSQLLFIKRCCYDQRMWESTVFETLRVLSVLLITVSTRTPVVQSKLSPPCCWYLVPPKHTAAMQGFFKLDLSIYWHSRWTSSSNCSASAMGGTLLHGPREPT